MKNQKKNTRLRDMIRYEKSQMLPLNFAMSYIITPIYVILAVLLLANFGQLMEAGGENALPMGLTCLGVLAVLTAALLCLVPFVRKRAIRTELRRYRLDRKRLPASQEEWDFSNKEISLAFNRYGMKVDGELYYYNHLRKLVITGNECQRVVIQFVFIVSEEQCILLPLNPQTLKMLEDFQVTLDNQETLDYILAEPEKAFAQIYAKGEVAPQK